MRTGSIRVLAALFATLALALGSVAPSGAATSSRAGDGAVASAKKKSKKKSTSRSKRCSKRAIKRAKGKAKKRLQKSCKKKPKKKKAKPKPAGPRPPLDYSKNKLSERRFEVTKDELMLPMPDGRSVYIEVVRPKAEGRYGVILEASGYHGTLYNREGWRILPQPAKKAGSDEPQGLTGYFAPRGYAVVMMDLRGTGKSQGCLDHLGPKDAQDLKAVVEWAASQAWSNGRVGMVGHSYVGSTPAVAAAQNPKGLVTIVPSAGLASIYDHQYQAGVPWNAQWLGPMEAYEQLALQADLPPELSPITEGTGTGPTGDNFPDGVAETGCGMQSSAVLAGESSLSGQYVGYHRARDWATPTRNWPGRIFLIHGVNDQAARIASIYWFNQRGVRPGDKLWLGQWDHGIGCCPNQRGLQWTLALHSWFDHTLLERNVDTGPPVELFMNDANVDADAIEKRREVMTGTQWPPPASPLVLRADPGSKLIRGSATDGSASFEGNLDGYLENRHATGLDFVGEALAQDTIVAGVPEVTLSVAQTMPRLHLIAHVMDESPSGERRRISTCAIQPELREGIDKITPVIPGERMNVKPPCFATAHRFRARHKIVLKVATSSDDHIPTFAMDPNVTVYTGSDGTSVSLPVAQSPAMFPDKIDLKAKGFGGSGA